VNKVIEYVTSIVTILLVLAGLGGLSYNFFKEGGWLGALFGKFVDAQMSNPVIAIPVTVALVFVGKMWFDHNRAKGHTSKLPDFLIYVIMAAGVYFIYRFATDGTL
jgi:hypothetical protein